MTRSNAWTISILILIFGDLLAVSVVNQFMEDEYTLDHEIQYKDAISSAKKLKLYPGPVPGCKSCTSEEITYCRSGQVLEDHCCCDSNYNEVFPFVEHTCRVGPEACKVHASDCAEYSRLRECCCHAFLASQWKYLAGSSGKPNPTVLQFIAIAVVLRLFL